MHLNMIGATCTGTAFPFGAHEFTSGFWFLIFYVELYFENHCLYVGPFTFDHGIVSPSLIYLITPLVSNNLSHL